MRRISPEERQACLEASLLRGVYDTVIDRESAYELLTKKVEDTQESEQSDPHSGGSILDSVLGGGSSNGGRRRQNPLEAMITSAARSIGSHIGRSISRGLFGSLTGGSRRRRY